MDVLTLLAWMEFDQLKAETSHKKETSELWLNHLSRKISTRITMINKDNEKDIQREVQEFEDAIRPDDGLSKGGKKSTKQVAKSFEWPDEDKFQKMIDLQNKGGG